MFSLLKRKRIHEEAPVITMERPTGEIQNMDEAIERRLVEYNKIAEEVGFFPPQAQYEKLRLFLSKNAIPVFDYRKVCEYLETQITGEATHWQWTPLRAADVEKETSLEWYSGYSAKHGKGLQGSGDGVSCGMIFVKSQYSKLIPKAILSQIAKIVKEFPTAKFYVSEITNIADPFVCVSFMSPSNRTGHEKVIFAVWDEPGW